MTVPKREMVLRWDGTDWVIAGLVSDDATIMKQGKWVCDFQEAVASAHATTKWLDCEFIYTLCWIDLGECVALSAPQTVRIDARLETRQQCCSAIRLPTPQSANPDYPDDHVYTNLIETGE